MKVNNTSTNPANATGVRGTKESERNAKAQDLTNGSGAAKILDAATPPTANAKNADASKVAMSPQAQSMQKAKAIAGKDTVDDAKVARLQKLIDEGKYKVDAKAVADRLVDEHLSTGE